MTYYDNQESVANIYVGLVERGWNCFGYKADESDSMTDYWSPARWEGIAEKNGFVLLVDVYSVSQSGYKVTKKGFTRDYDKISKLKATINDKASSLNEKETAQKIIDNMINKENESIQVVSEYPTFKNANPKGCNWHIEKDGNIIAKGKGAFQCDGYLFSHDREATMKKVNTFIDKIESKINSSEQLQEVQEKVITKVIKPVEVTVNVNEFVKDQTVIKLNSSFTGSHYKGELLQLVYIHTYTKNAQEFTSYEFVKLGKKYQQLKRYGAANNTLNLNSKQLAKWLENGSILTVELKEVEEITYKTVYKKVSRKGQESNFIESAEVVEEVKTSEQPKKETVQSNLNNESLTVEMKINDKLNGIELYFTGKPSEGTRLLLKENGFYWGGKNKPYWYTRKTDKSLLFAESFVSAFNDITFDEVETMEPVEVQEMPVNVAETQNNTNAPEEENNSINEETDIYNNEIIETPLGYYCHFKSWNFEVEDITKLLTNHNIPFYEVGEKFIFEEIDDHQLQMIKLINEKNGSILFDDCYRYEEIQREVESKRDNEAMEAALNSEIESLITEQTKQPKQSNNNVIDFSSRLKQKQEKQEQENAINHFIKDILPYLSFDDKMKLYEAQNNKEKFNSIMFDLLLKAKGERIKEN